MNSQERKQDIGGQLYDHHLADFKELDERFNGAIEEAESLGNFETAEELKRAHETARKDINNVHEKDREDMEKGLARYESSSQEPSHDEMASLYGSASQEPEQEQDVQQTKDQDSGLEQETSTEDHDPSEVYDNSQDIKCDEPENEPER